MSLLTAFFAIFLAACDESEQPYNLQDDHYDWVCYDYENHSEVVITTDYCCCDVTWLVGQVELVDGQFWKRKLDPAEETEQCTWETMIPLNDNYCTHVDKVTLIAYMGE